MTKANESKPLVAGLAGFGTVGGGLARLLKENADIIRRRTGRDIVVKRVLVRNAQKARNVPLPEGAELTTDPALLTDDPDIDVLVELIGGIDQARALIDRALDQGKHIVTANKALLAEEGLALFQKAERKKRILRYEASVAGAIPIVQALKESLTGNRIESLMGILNGTSNYILSEMTSNGLDFDLALKQAQELGYAEADPSADIDGDDVRRKLTISANIAFDTLLREEDIPMFGIRTVTDEDIRTFQAHGFVCKLLATAKAAEDGVCAFIEPTLVASHDLEAAVPKNFNLITYYGEKIGRHSFFGQGAGRYPTAFNAVEDCLDILAGKHGFYTDAMGPTAVTNTEEAHPYYVRTACPDEFLQSVTAERWESGIVTACVSVADMLRWGREQLKKDPTCFLAGIR